MTAYLQMGHDTENLVGENDLEEFKGVILSPVNREPDKLRENVSTFRKRGEYDIILDPQLYYPRGQRENLIQQPYFPDAFDTSDFSVASGWTDAINKLATFAEELEVNGVASPINTPRRWANEFYDTSVEISYLLSQKLKSSLCRVLTTCMVSLADLDKKDRVRQIASIMTRYDTEGFYIVMETGIDPRRELSDADGLANFMLLINLLQQHAPVTVAYSSSDMILFKAAGASNCGTSKFFNLRRFTMSRFDEPPTGGGGQIPYWFEHNLLAFIREADIRRLQKNGYNEIIGGLHSGGHWGQIVLEFLDNYPGEAWLGKSWRQYLSWFGKTEMEVSSKNSSIVKKWLKSAEQYWQQLDDDEILMDEPRNNGNWIRPWRQALRDFNHSL